MLGTKRKTAHHEPATTSGYRDSVKTRLAPLHLMTECEVEQVLGLISETAKTPEDAMDALREAAAAIIEARKFAEALRQAVRMMGLDPDKLTKASQAPDLVYPHILLGSVAPDPEALKARGASNIEGWMSMWQALKG